MNNSTTLTNDSSLFQDSYDSAPMPRLLNSEIFLIILVISLWLISVFVCLRRYSLFICFHKRDVPFYNSNLINIDLNKINISHHTQLPQLESRPISPISPVHIHNKASLIFSINETENENDNLIVHELASNNALSSYENKETSLNNQLVDSSSFNSSFIKKSNLSDAQITESKTIDTYKSSSTYLSKMNKYGYLSNRAANIKKFNNMYYKHNANGSAILNKSTKYSNKSLLALSTNKNQPVSPLANEMSLDDNKSMAKKNSIDTKRAVIRSKEICFYFIF